MTRYERPRDDSGQHRISIEGSKEEIEALERMLAGTVLVGYGRDGVPLDVPIHHKVDLSPDPVTAKHWPWFGPDGKTTALAYWDQKDFAFTKSTYDPHRFPAGVELAPHLMNDTGHMLTMTISIYVSGLGGYGSDKAELERRQLVMKEVGFEPMRSPRGEDGKYWEVWYLPGSWSAKGVLNGATLHEILRWVVREVGPGSIDLVTQRLALGVPD